MFICNHCPYVQAVEDRYVALARAYGPKGVQFVGICSNDPTGYPEDAPAELLARWRKKGYGFPYLVDASQDVARTFDAVCTPDIYVYDRDRRLAYHGRIDDNWKEPSKVTRRELAWPRRWTRSSPVPRRRPRSTTRSAARSSGRRAERDRPQARWRRRSVASCSDLHWMQSVVTGRAFKRSTPIRPPHSSQMP
jgi:hypothetical protein